MLVLCIPDKELATVLDTVLNKYYNAPESMSEDVQGHLGQFIQRVLKAEEARKSVSGSV